MRISDWSSDVCSSDLRIVNAGAKRALSDAEIAAYDAPFPTRASKVAARIFPSFVPLGANVAVPDQKRAWSALERFDKPFLCCFTDGDPITRGGDALFRSEEHTSELQSLMRSSYAGF